MPNHFHKEIQFGEDEVYKAIFFCAQKKIPQITKPKQAYETYDNVESFCCPCNIDENHEGGCLATCSSAFCACIPFGTLSEWTEVSVEYPHPSSSMKWSIVYLICGSFGFSPCMNIMLYTSFYSHLKSMHQSYPGVTCCGCLGMVCCPTCAFVKMQRLKAFHKTLDTPVSAITKNKMES